MPKPSYETHALPYLDQIAEWYKTMSVRQIAKKLGVSKTTLYKWATENAALQQALDKGKEDLVGDLHSALKRRALGYDYEETTVKQTDSEKNGLETVTTTVKKHLPPDLGSIHLLLKNLDPDWHNDDHATLEMKRKELEIKQQRADAESW